MTTRGEQAQKRCRVQAMRLASDERLLYTTQFHPEIRVFDESTKEDVGFGNFFIASFLGRARCWWQERPGIALVGA